MISTDARKLASFDITTRDNIRRYQCDNPIILLHERYSRLQSMGRKLKSNVTVISQKRVAVFFSNATGLRPIYVMFFKILHISFQMKNNDEMWL